MSDVLTVKMLQWSVILEHIPLVFTKGGCTSMPATGFVCFKLESDSVADAKDNDTPMFFF